MYFKIKFSIDFWEMEDVTCSCRLLVNQVHYYIQLNSMLDEDGNFIKDKNVEKYFLCYGINNNRLIEEIDFFSN